MHHNTHTMHSHIMNDLEVYHSTTVNYLYSYGEVARRLLLVAFIISLQGVIADSILSFPRPSNIMYTDAVLHFALLTNFLISFTSVSICMTNNLFTIRLLSAVCAIVLGVLCCLWINVVWWTAYSLVSGTISDVALVSYSRLLLSMLVSTMVSTALLIYFKNRNFLLCCCCMLQPTTTTVQPRGIVSVAPPLSSDHRALLTAPATATHTTSGATTTISTASSSSRSSSPSRRKDDTSLHQPQQQFQHSSSYGTINPTTITADIVESPQLSPRHLKSQPSRFMVGDQVLVRLDNGPTSLWYPATVARVKLHHHHQQSGLNGAAVFLYDVVFYDGEVSKNRPIRDIMAALKRRWPRQHRWDEHTPLVTSPLDDDNMDTAQRSGGDVIERELSCVGDENALSSRNGNGSEKWIHQADGWTMIIYIHIVLSMITVVLFSIAYWNSASLSGNKVSKAFVGAYVLVLIAFATVSLAAIITAFQDYAVVSRAAADGSLAKKIEFALFVVESLVSRPLEPQLSEEKPVEEFSL